jgi:hypothetical protein
MSDHFVLARKIKVIAAEASKPEASERRSRSNLCRWGFWLYLLSQNILAQCIVVMRDRKCAVSYFSVVLATLSSILL